MTPRLSCDLGHGLCAAAVWNTFAPAIVLDSIKRFLAGSDHGTTADHSQSEIEPQKQPSKDPSPDPDIEPRPEPNPDPRPRTPQPIRMCHRRLVRRFFQSTILQTEAIAWTRRCPGGADEGQDGVTLGSRQYTEHLPTAYCPFAYCLKAPPSPPPSPPKSKGGNPKAGGKGKNQTALPRQKKGRPERNWGAASPRPPIEPERIASNADVEATV